jgi:hypothetical protein
LSKANAIHSQLVQVWRLNFATKASNITETSIVCHDKNHIGSFLCHGALHEQYRSGGAGQNEIRKHSSSWRHHQRIIS